MRGVGQISQPQVVEYGPLRVEAEIAALAERQHGVVATRQLVALGWSQQAVAKRVAAGRELTDYPALDAVAAAHSGHRGARKLHEALRSHHAGTDVTKSDFEALFLGLCKDNGLPTPRVNPTVAGKEVDFLFLDDRLVVETDSWRYHKTRQAFENDRARDARLARASYRTLRFTDRQLEREPRMVVATVRSHLTRP
jgi:very-short-patch-repair endonuclease